MALVFQVVGKADSALAVLQRSLGIFEREGSGAGVPITLNSDDPTFFGATLADECAALDVPFFLEPIYYDDDIKDELELARRKPANVTRYMEEFSKPRYGVDVLKVEVPVNVKYVEGMRVFGGTSAYTRQEAMNFFRESAAAATKPFIYLSAGVSDEVFRETLELAAEAGTAFSGVLCGRATWQDGIPIYAKGGASALEEWLLGRGVQNIQALNEVLAVGAKPWHTIYGGMDQIRLV